MAARSDMKTELAASNPKAWDVVYGSQSSCWGGLVEHTVSCTGGSNVGKVVARAPRPFLLNLGQSPQACLDYKGCFSQNFKPIKIVTVVRALVKILTDLLQLVIPDHGRQDCRGSPAPNGFVRSGLSTKHNGARSWVWQAPSRRAGQPQGNTRGWLCHLVMGPSQQR